MRSKMIIITFFIISISSIFIYAHKQHVHQYLTKEAYYQLRDYLGYDIPEMLAHLDNGPVGASWTNGTWREDEEDVVFHYSMYNPPTLTGVIPSTISALQIYSRLSNVGVKDRSLQLYLIRKLYKLHR